MLPAQRGIEISNAVAIGHIAMRVEADKLEAMRRDLDAAIAKARQEIAAWQHCAPATT
jgi:hypothetical protein